MDITYGCMCARSAARNVDSGPQYRDARVDDTNRRRLTVSLRHSDQRPRPVHIPACSVQYTSVQELNGYNTAGRGPCGHNHWEWLFGEAPAFGGQDQGIPHLYWVLALDNKFFLWISYRIILTVFVSESSQPSQLWHTVTGDTRL